VKKPRVEPVFKKPFPKKTALEEVQEVIPRYLNIQEYKTLPFRWKKK
jgi:hypothetical protein